MSAARIRFPDDRIILQLWKLVTLKPVDLQRLTVPLWKDLNLKKINTNNTLKTAIGHTYVGPYSNYSTKSLWLDKSAIYAFTKCSWTTNLNFKLISFWIEYHPHKNCLLAWFLRGAATKRERPLMARVRYSILIQIRLFWTYMVFLLQTNETKFQDIHI